MKKIVFFIGFMGTGKTTLGKKLAKELDFNFIDLDSKIEGKYGISIDEFFQQHGEDEFRKVESFILKEIILEEDYCVISVGGGTPCFNKNMELMNQYGTTIYLQRPNKELFNRLKNSKKTRPLIKEFRDSDVELKNYIETTIKEREPFYNMAQIILDRNHQEVKIIKQILNEPTI
ncbi:MAG: shikimate kinase [Brumimicrobium sp.]